MAEDDLPEDADSLDDLTTEDLEEAYLKALDALESADWAVDEGADGDVEPSELAPELNLPPDPEPVERDNQASMAMEIATADFLASPAEPSADTTPESSVRPAPRDSETWIPGGSADSPVAPATAHGRPSRVIEACLFVGGQPLSAKKLANLLEGNNDPADIEVLIDELNLEYAAQSRPYEIRLGDGGYRLALRTEFDAVRGRVYGVGPRDVKLSQDVLEILALVAYQQPISQSAIEACKPNSANVLRQLLRRELISLTRVDQSRNGVEYRTTPRFLQLFGLGQLSELPRPEDLSIR